MFSPPVAAREKPNSDYSRPKPPKRKHSRAEALPKPSTTGSSTLPLKATKPRRLSVPPSFPSTKTKPTPRQTSAPARVSADRYASVSRQPWCSTRHTTPTTPTPPLNTPPACDLGAYPYPGPSSPPYSRSPLSPNQDRIAHTLQDMPYTLTGPTTPPTLLPGLFSEPIVAPSSPVHLSPGSSLIPIADPFLQFLPQYGYFSDPSLVSSLNYGESSPGLAPGAFFPKGASGTPLALDHRSHDIPVHMTFDPFEIDFFNVYTAAS